MGRWGLGSAAQKATEVGGGPPHPGPAEKRASTVRRHREEDDCVMRGDREKRIGKDLTC